MYLQQGIPAGTWKQSLKKQSNQNIQFDADFGA